MCWSRDFREAQPKEGSETHRTPSRADFVDLSTAPSTPKITAHDGNPKASERIEGAEGQEDGESLSSSKVSSPLRLRLA